MNIKNLLKAKIYITKDYPGKEVIRYRFNYFQIIFFISIYSFFLFFVFMFLVSLITPLRNKIFIYENAKIKDQAVRIKQLENEVAIITNELNKFVKLNKRLNYAILLAESDSIDSSAAIYDSLRKVENPNKLNGGNLFFIVENILNSIFPEKQKQPKDNLFFISPVDKIVIVKKFDKANHHLGIDFAIKPHTPIKAPASGYVIFSGFTAIDGNIIIIQHKNNFRTVLKHCSIVLINTGDKVYKGEIIAYSGNSGLNTTGPHLHFEIWKDDKVLNPEKIIVN